MSAEDIVAALVKRRVSKATAVQYADAFAEYREASDNIGKHGAIVKHPRTGNPIRNPYLAVRDGALDKLRKMQNRGLDVDFLW